MIEFTTAEELHAKVVREHHNFYKDDPDAQLPPMIIPIGSDSPYAEAKVLPNRDVVPLKAQQLAACFSLLMMGAQLYVYSAEAWFDTVSKEELSDIEEGGGLSKRESKREGVITVVCQKGEAPIVSVHELVRDSATGVASLGDDIFKTEGWDVNKVMRPGWENLWALEDEVRENRRLAMILDAVAVTPPDDGGEAPKGASIH